MTTEMIAAIPAAVSGYYPFAFANVRIGIQRIYI